MLILENFIIRLLKNKKIINYKADIGAVRDAYNNEYVHEAGYPFDEFADDLWRSWYIIHFSENQILFERNWIDYFTEMINDKGRNSKQRNILSEEECLVCFTKFGNGTTLLEHIEDESHIIRLKYLRNNDKFFKKNDNFSLRLLELNNTSISDSQAIKIKSEVKTNLSATIQITNSNTVEYEILYVLKINLLNTDLIIAEPTTPRQFLKTGQSFQITLNGYFENSTSFLFPIVLVVQAINSRKRVYVLKEIPVEITSEYSQLGSGEPYEEPINYEHSTSSAIIIHGENLPRYSSNYAEAFPLKFYPIPSWFENKLADIISRYPSFINIYQDNRSNYSFHKECAREMRISETLNQTNYFRQLRTLIDIEENQLKIDVRSYDTSSTLRRVRGNVFELQVPGLAEARPSLLVGDSVYIKETLDHSHKFQGIVHKVLESSVYLGFNSRFSNIYINDKSFFVEFGFNRRSLRAERQAVELAQEHDITSYFFPKLDAITTQYGAPDKELGFYDYFNINLNLDQKRAVNNILVPKPVPYLIFGPPGTGKTVTVVESVMQIWKTKPKSKILICAPSNSAANELAVRLLLRIPSSEILRLFGRCYIQDKTAPELKKISNIQSDNSIYMPCMQELLGYRILITTLVTAARIVNGGVPQGHYSYVFIDESGYATETESLIPIAGILSNVADKGKVTGQVVMAGDPRQLGPVIHSHFVKFCGYDKSMFERLLDTCDIYSRDGKYLSFYDAQYITKLLKNYRSNEKILKVPNELFYHNELFTTYTETSNIFDEWEHLKTANFPVIFHNVLGEDKREKSSPSFFNTQEIEEVMGYVSKIINTRVQDMEINESHFGLITPYRKQAELLKKACAKHSWHDILVGSVEQFQGREKLVVIISTVRSKNIYKFEEIDKKCQIGFVGNPKRFNVALTRAQALLIVVGNADVLKTDKYWCRFLQYCRDNNSIAGKPFDLS